MWTIYIPLCVRRGDSVVVFRLVAGRMAEVVIHYIHYHRYNVSISNYQVPVPSVGLQDSTTCLYPLVLEWVVYEYLVAPSGQKGRAARKYQVKVALVIMSSSYLVVLYRLLC